jgi:prevent-host-death family protein
MQQDSEGPTMKTMSATAASKEFGRFIDAAQREPVLLTKKDRPVAVTVSVADWEELLSLRIERGIAAGLADVAAGRVVEMTDDALEQRLARFRTRSAEA